MNRNSMNSHLVEGMATYDFSLHFEGPSPHYVTLEVPWDGLWTLSFGLSQFHGHGSWLMLEVALRVTKWVRITKPLIQCGPDPNSKRNVHIATLPICIESLLWSLADYKT